MNAPPFPPGLIISGSELQARLDRLMGSLACSPAYPPVLSQLRPLTRKNLAFPHSIQTQKAFKTCGHIKICNTLRYSEGFANVFS